VRAAVESAGVETDVLFGEHTARLDYPVRLTIAKALACHFTCLAARRVQALAAEAGPHAVRCSLDALNRPVPANDLHAAVARSTARHRHAQARAAHTPESGFPLNGGVQEAYWQTKLSTCCSRTEFSMRSRPDAGLVTRLVACPSLHEVDTMATAHFDDDPIRPRIYKPGSSRASWTQPPPVPWSPGIRLAAALAAVWLVPTDESRWAAPVAVFAVNIACGAFARLRSRWGWVLVGGRGRRRRLW